MKRSEGVYKLFHLQNNSPEYMGQFSTKEQMIKMFFSSALSLSGTFNLTAQEAIFKSEEGIDKDCELWTLLTLDSENSRPNEIMKQFIVSFEKHNPSQLKNLEAKRNSKIQRKK